MARAAPTGGDPFAGLVCEGPIEEMYSRTPQSPSDESGDDEVPFWFLAGSLTGSGDKYLLQEAARQTAQAATRTAPGLQAVNVGGVGGAEVCSFGQGNAQLGHAIAQPGVGLETAAARTGSSWWQRVTGNVARFANSAAGKLIGGATLVIGAVAAASDVADVVRNSFDDDVSVLAREEWYKAVKAYQYSRAVFGSAPDVPWYEQIGWSVYNTLDVVVPASWHKLVGPVVDPVASNWIGWCEGNLRAGRRCNPF